MIKTSLLVSNERKIKTKHLSTKIMAYECKIHKMLSIRMKAEHFTMWKYDFGPDSLQFDVAKPMNNFTEI